MKNPKLKIMHIVSNRWNSAICEYAVSSALAHKLLGHDVTCVGLGGAPYLKRTQSMNTAAVKSFSPMGWSSLKAVFLKVKPDLVVTYGGPETTLASFCPSPTYGIIRVRGNDVPRANSIDALFHELSHTKIKVLVTPSRKMAEDLKKISKIPTEFIQIGLDEASFVLSSTWTKQTTPELLIFGRFDPIKGHENFMKIFKRLLDLWETPNKPRLKIVGLPANLSTEEMRGACLRQGLMVGRDVEIISEKISDVPKLLSSVTLGVVSSLGSELICRVAEEFLMCGTPVFLSGVGSLEETLCESGFGNSYKDLADDDAALKLKECLTAYASESPEVRRERSVLAAKHFSIAAMGRAWDSVIRQIVRF